MVRETRVLAAQRAADGGDAYGVSPLMIPSFYFYVREAPLCGGFGTSIS